MGRLTALFRTAWKRPEFSFVQFIKWWMLLRVALVATTLAVVFFFSPEGTRLEKSYLPPSVTLFTILVSWLFYRSVRRGDPPEINLYLQDFIDIFLISLLNLIATPADVSFVPLYMLTITLGGILSLRTGALFAATAASIFYLPAGLGVLSLGLTFTRQFEINVLYISDKRIWMNMGLQVFLFYMIALITSYLSLRLRRTGGELEDMRRLLRQQRMDTDEILRNIDTGLVTVNSGGTVVYANPAACRMIGMEPRRALGRQAESLFKTVCPEMMDIISQVAGSRERPLLRLVHLETPRGSLPVAVNPSPIFEPDGGYHGVSLILQDVSLELRASELEQRTGKLEAVAELSAALAHEIKNPLASIRSAVEILNEPSSGHNGAEKKLMDCVIRESDRLSELLRQFLQFASGSFGPPQTVCLGEAAAAALEDIIPHPDWRKSVNVLIDPEAGKMLVRANAASLTQVFFNLFINSVQAAGPDGRKVQNIRISMARPDGHAAGGKPLLWLRVEDDGPGIEAAVRARIFEPFFTTRRQGFGLGMAVVHRIVSSLGGSIQVEERPAGGGAAFLIGLPAAESADLSGVEPVKRNNKARK